MTPNALNPSHMEPDERLSELAEILAAGFLRLQARESSRNSRDLREFPLDLAARPSVHGRPKRSTGDGG
jgi:hypothetical protein